MNERATKGFDCVRDMRRIRDRLSAEIAGLDHEGLRQALRLHEGDDPLLERLARRACTPSARP